MGGKVIDGDPRIWGKSREIPGSGYAIRSEMIKSPDLGQESWLDMLRAVVKFHPRNSVLKIGRR